MSALSGSYIRRQGYGLDRTGSGYVPVADSLSAP